MLDNLDTTTLAQLGLVRPNDSSGDAAKAFAQSREEIIDMMFKAQMDGAMEGQMCGEQVFYETFKVFIPPPKLLDRHPGFERCARMDEPLSARVKKQVSSPDVRSSSGVTDMYRSRPMSGKLGS
jgi:hypothetical protein